MSRFARAAGAPPHIYGHRGTRIGAPENTLRAMRLALTQGATGIELDVRLCASGEPVVVHDPDLVRVANVPLVVAETDLTHLRAVSLDQGEHVPLLDEALALTLDAGALLNIELKSDIPDAAALVRAVVWCVARRPIAQRERVLFSSFDVAICAALSALAPRAHLAFLTDRPPTIIPEGCTAVHLHHDCADAAQISSLKESGLIVNAWTVNEPERAAVLTRSGIDGIITDDIPKILAHIVQ